MRSKEVDEYIDYLKTRLSLFHNNHQFATEQAIEGVLNYISKLEEELDSARRKNESFKNQLDECVHIDTIIDLKEKYEKKCAVLGKHSDKLQWYEMGKNFGKVDLCEELLGE